MTIGARLSQPSGMGIRLAVAIDAARRGLAVGLPGRVTGAAGQQRVLSFQGEVASRMIEALEVQADDVRVRPFVVGVTDPALPVSFETTVEALSEIDVPLDGLVATKAEQLLRAPLEAFVAIRTVASLARMGREEGAGRDQALEIDGPGQRDRGDPLQQDRTRQERNAPGTSAERLAAHGQYMCTATTWTAAAMKRTMQKGRWSACHIANARS